MRDVIAGFGVLIAVMVIFAGSALMVGMWLGIVWWAAGWVVGR